MVEDGKNTSKDKLMSRNVGTLSCKSSHYSVGTLEQALLKRFPSHDAASWDRTGLLVGDRRQTVLKVAFALDPTVDTIESACEQGANVLITHHPAYLEAPDAFSPAASPALNAGALVWKAIEKNVALMSFHTALDVSREAGSVLPGMLKLEYQSVLQPIDEEGLKGFGQCCVPASSERDLTLGQLAARCTSVFGRQPRVWGDFSRTLQQLVTCTGSSGGLVNMCLERDVDCLICGEIRYHDALNATRAGLSIIDLGHDTSELPLVGVLASTVRDLEIPEEHIVIIDQNANWSYPEATRR